ncbi:MAG TPA: dihydroneopterin aldolase [Gemmatimonadaceae bacterium]|nr:dihydroneopterin aldolase [Gemmatimonadaceae bacterium]
MPRRDAITLRGMRFHARVGILPHEREHPQPLEVDLTVWLAPVETGDSATIVDYRGLYDLVAQVVGEDALLHLEDVGGLIAERAAAITRVARVRVALRKPRVALPGPLAHAEVVVMRDAR